MRKSIFTVLSLLVFASAALSQGKIDTKWHCNAPKEQLFSVGDKPDHSYAMIQGNCTTTSSAKGFAEKSGTFTESQERWKASTSGHGYFNVTMDNGDMVYYTYSGKTPTDQTKPAHNTWKIESGTGKHKGITATGTCTGKLSADGSSDWTCSGTYSMGK